ncbi:hypothetical protein ScPMuIL_014127 [Solemya velum]
MVRVLVCLVFGFLATAFEATEKSVDLVCIDRLICRSEDGLTNFCTVGKEDTLYRVEPLGESSQDEYGIGENGLWVSNGHGGHFRVCVKQTALIVDQIECKGSIAPQISTDEGYPDQPTVCQPNQNEALYRGEVLEVMNGTCTLNQTYGFTESGVWVTADCSGRFRVRLVPECTEIICSSYYGMTAKCSLPPEYANHVITNVTMIEQFSSTLCAERQTYSVHHDYITAYGRCEGLFRVCTKLGK